jgi:hypothetical protein
MFKAGYQYELIRRGFNKETLTEIKNLILIPIIALIFMTARFNVKENLFRNMQILIIAKLILNIIVFVWMPTAVWPVIITMLLSNAVGRYGGMVDSTVVNILPVKTM